MTRKQIEAAAEEAGWNVTIRKEKDGWFIMLTTDSHLDQDVCFEYNVDRLEDIVHEVENTYEGYDPEQEATAWYGNCPHSLTNLIEDMREVDGKLEDLCITLNGGHISKPEEKIDLTRKANNLREECLSTLVSFSHRARPSKHGVDAKGFDNPDRCSKYEEIIFLDYRWVLVDGDGLQYSVECMPLEEFCEMVDAIVNRKED